MESLWKSAVKNFTGSASNPEGHQQPPLTLPFLPDVHYNMKSSKVILYCLEYNSITFCALNVLLLCYIHALSVNIGVALESVFRYSTAQL